MKRIQRIQSIVKVSPKPYTYAHGNSVFQNAVYKPGKIYLSTIINIIGKHLNDKSNSNTCCRANTAKCRSCAAGLDIEEYCENNPTIIGCEGVKFNKICYHWLTVIF